MFVFHTLNEGVQKISTEPKIGLLFVSYLLPKDDEKWVNKSLPYTVNFY